MTLGIRLLLLVLIAAVPVFAAQVYGEYQQRETRKLDLSHQALQTARLLAAEQVRFIEGARYLLTAAAQLPEVHNLDGETCSAQLARFAAQLPHVSSLGAVAPDGTTFCRSTPGQQVNIADRDFFQDAVRDKAFSMSGYVVDRQTGNGALAFAYPALAPSGVVDAVMILTYDIENLSQALAATSLPEGAVIELIDRNGAILARTPESERWVGRDVRDRGFVQAVLAQREGTLRAGGLDGFDRSYGFAPVSAPSGLFVVVGLSEAVAFAEFDRLFWQRLGLLGAAFLMAAVAALVGAEIGIRRPVLELKRAVKRLKRGDLSARPLLRGHGIRELASLARNVTEMARALQMRETELRLAKEAAELATQAKSRFLAAASHDLRQPLQAMRLFLHLLTRRLHDAETRGIAGQLADSMSAGENLLNAMLDISRLEAGTVRLQPTIFPVQRLLDQLVAEYEPQARAKGLLLRAQPCHSAVYTDAMLLERILRNLVSNAVRYTEQGRIVLGCRRRSGKLRIEVWDTGPGIPEDKQQAIFEDFYQLDNAERDRAQGYGLGLAIVRRLARLLDHRVRLYSQPGKGSMFAIELPSAEARPVPLPAKPKPAGPSLAGLRVLLVEDDAVQRLALEEILKQWHCAVIGAGSAEAAIAAARSGAPAPDVILTDFRLPRRQTGLDVIDGVCQGLSRTIPALILTGELANDQLREAAQRGYRILHKPLDPDHLGAAIAEMLGRQAA